MRISTDRQVRAAGPGRHGVDGAGIRGLMLIVAPSGARSWVQRLQRDGRRHDFGLGSYPSVGLASAREKSIELRRAAKTGESLFAAKASAPIWFGGRSGDRLCPSPRRRLVQPPLCRTGDRPRAACPARDRRCT